MSSFIRFLKRNEKILIWTFIFTLVCFGFMLTTHTVTIDEETWLLNQVPSLLWLFQGRFGVQFFNEIFTNHGSYAPFLWDFLSVALWFLSGVLFFFCLFGKRTYKSWQLFIFCGYYSSVPFVVGEILSFSMFNLQVCTAMIAAAAAFLYTLIFLEKKDKKSVIYILILLVYAFSVYQALICVYVTAVVAYCLQSLLEERKEISKVVLTTMCFCILSIVLYCAINSIITIITGSASYLSDNYIGWNHEKGVLYALFLAVANIVRVSLSITIQSVGIYSGAVIRIVTVLFILYSVYIFFKNKGVKRKIGILFFTIALVAAPFILYLALGTYQTHGRHLLALPLAGAVQLYLILSSITRKHLKTAVVALSGFLLFINARNMNMLFYCGSVAYEHDKNVANQIMHDIRREGFDYHQKPIVYLGLFPMDQVPISVADTIGGSMFAWDQGNITRIQDFLQTEGYETLLPNADEIKEALKLRAQMTQWPRSGSILETNRVIIVNFSEPDERWYQTNNVADETS